VVSLNKSYPREPIEAQTRALQHKKKDRVSKIDALLDEARKKGVEPGQLRCVQRATRHPVFVLCWTTESDSKDKRQR
jgi:hypothetical protein